MPLEKNQIVDVTSLFINKHEIKAEPSSKARPPFEGFLALIKYYSGFGRLIHAVCYIFGVVKACLMKNKRKRKSFFNLGLSPLSVHEREATELFIGKMVQQDYFGELYLYIHALKGSVCYKVSKSLKRLFQPLKNSCVKRKCLL